MAEERCPSGVQCTDSEGNSGQDVLACVEGQLNHRILPEEVQNLYDQTAELVLKNRAKDEFIDELRLKVQQLEKELQDTRVEHLQRELVNRENNRQSEGPGDTGVECSGRGDRTGDEVERNFTQRLLLRVTTVERENKELRAMYNELLDEKKKLDGLARQCLMQEDRIKQYEWMETLYNQKEAECERAVRRVNELEAQLQILKQSVEESSSVSAVHHQSSLSSQTQPVDPSSLPQGFPDAPDLPHLTQEDSAPSQDRRSIRLNSQMSPPLKRGRFTVLKIDHKYHCSKCSVVFASKEEAAQTPCSYHPKVPVRAIVRSDCGGVDPVEPPDILWRCCNQLGKQAMKCARCSTHDFNRVDEKRKG